MMSFLLAALAATGVGLCYWSLTANAYRSFSDRIAPQLHAAYMASAPKQERTQAQGSKALLYSLLEPLVQRWENLSNASGPSEAKIAERMRRAGVPVNVRAYRTEQILWALGAIVCTAALSTLGYIQSRMSLPLAGILMVLSALSGFLGRDWALDRAVKKREAQLLAEFPPLAEMMALSVTAGESAIGALERICRISRGELAQEFEQILDSIRTGSSVQRACRDYAHNSHVPALSRFVEGIAVAIERGTPLAEVLRAQAQDVRDASQRELVESAAKKEIGMMVPVVFMILPLTVLFAIFPGIALLRLDF